MIFLSPRASTRATAASNGSSAHSPLPRSPTHHGAASSSHVRRALSLAYRNSPPGACSDSPAPSPPPRRPADEKTLHASRKKTFPLHLFLPSVSRLRRPSARLRTRAASLAPPRDAVLAEGDVHRLERRELEAVPRPRRPHPRRPRRPRPTRRTPPARARADTSASVAPERSREDVPPLAPARERRVRPAEEERVGAAARPVGGASGEGGHQRVAGEAALVRVPEARPLDERARLRERDAEVDARGDVSEELRVFRVGFPAALARSRVERALSDPPGARRGGFVRDAARRSPAAHARAEVVVLLSPSPVRVRVPVDLQELFPRERPRAAVESAVGVLGASPAGSGASAARRGTDRTGGSGRRATGRRRGGRSTRIRRRGARRRRRGSGATRG